MSPSTSSSPGPRPAALRLHRDSHPIHKPSTTSSSSSSLSSITTKPLIVYTHSPKVIHTNARDFMALVQKLTGLSHPPELSNATSSLTGLKNGDDNGRDDDESSSENCSGFLADDVHGSSSSLSSVAAPTAAPVRALSPEFLCAPAMVYGRCSPDSAGAPMKSFFEC